MIVEIDIVIDQLIGLIEGSGLMPVNAFCFEDGEEIFSHSIIVAVSAS